VPYLYKKEKKTRLTLPLNRISQAAPDEMLTGVVRGENASDLEERYSRALDKLEKDYEFQYEVYVAGTLPGEEKLVDFVVYDGGIPFPEEVDAAFTHKTAEQKGYDAIRDAVVDDSLKSQGFQPIVRIDGERMNTQEGADLVAEELHG
jgi:hypothetical protein